jgi:hypothetical protein
MESMRADDAAVAMVMELVESDAMRRANPVPVEIRPLPADKLTFRPEPAVAIKSLAVATHEPNSALSNAE